MIQHLQPVTPPANREVPRETSPREPMLTGARLVLWKQLQMEKKLERELQEHSQKQWDQDTQRFLDSLQPRGQHPPSASVASQPVKVLPLLSVPPASEDVVYDVPSHTEYSSDYSSGDDAPMNNPQAIKLIETDSIVDGDILPSDATPGTEALPSTSHQDQGVAVVEEGVEEDGKWIHGASPFYAALVKKIIVGQGYALEPSAYPVVSLCSDNDKPVTQTYRLPPNPYILGRLEQYRQQVIEDTSSKPANKAFPRPPISLERVAELGDPVSQKQVSSSVSRAVRKVPQPPDVWNYILADHVDNSKPIHPTIKLEKAQARQMELSVIWALKGANYVDHFTMYQKQLADKVKDKILGLQKWASNTDVPDNVQSVIASILSGVQETRQVMDESQDIFKSIVNSLIFQKGVLEFSRRDNLDYLISRLVTDHTRTQLRNSQFSTRHCYDPDLCSKARKEYTENKNLRELRGKRQNNQQHNNHNNKNTGGSFNNNSTGFYRPRPYPGRRQHKKPPPPQQRDGTPPPQHDRNRQQHHRGGGARGGGRGAQGGRFKGKN